MKNILLAGATGYLGKYIAKELKSRGYTITLLVRNQEKLKLNHIIADQIFEGDMSDENFYHGVMHNIDVVISTIGITRQKDANTYMSVDYGVNHLLLQEALRENVQKFIYTSVLHGEELQHLKICEAKERFVKELQSSNIDSLIVRPTGFFSDMEEFLKMAINGRIFLLGNGTKKVNPIDGEDLAGLIINAMKLNLDVLEIGGPNILTHKEIAELAFSSIGKAPSIFYIPLWIQTPFLFFLRLLSTEKTYGPIEFFLNVMNLDMTSNIFGSKTLTEHFDNFIQKNRL